MSTAVDRMWNIRDAILAWLYEAKATMEHIREVDAEPLQAAVGWASDPITDNELRRDVGYLLEENFIRGIETYGGSLIRPELTARGENHAARAVSVRPGDEREANPTGGTVTNSFTFNNNGAANYAVGGNNISQTANYSAPEEVLSTLAGLLDSVASEHPDGADDIRELAEEIRAADDLAEPTAQRGFFIRALQGLNNFLGSEAGQQAFQLASTGLQAVAAG